MQRNKETNGYSVAVNWEEIFKCLATSYGYLVSCASVSIEYKKCNEYLCVIIPIKVTHCFILSISLMFEL